MNILPLAALAILTASPVHAQAIADLAAIDAAVAAFTGTPTGVSGGAALPVDRRMKLRACGAPLALDWFGARHDTVQVSCPLAGGWRIYVPLRQDGQAVIADPPVVARGDAVSVIISGEGFAVSQQGEALEAGAHGAWIKIRMAGGKADPIRARVLRPGAVGIVLP